MRVFQKEFPKGFYFGQREDGFPLDDILKQNLDFIKKNVLFKNHDATFIFDGRVGTGKTTLALQIGKYLDNNFCLDKVVFTPNQFLEALKKAQKGDCIVFDEAMILNSRNALSQFNKAIVIMMSQIRSKNLFIFFILPSIFDLDRNLSLYRVNLLFHVYSKQFGKRGSYACFFQDRVKSLFLNGKKYYSYTKPKPNLYANFSRCFVLNEKDYENKKQEAISQLALKKPVTDFSKIMLQRDKLIRYLYNSNLNLTQQKIADIIGNISRRDISKICLKDTDIEDLEVGTGNRYNIS